MNVRVDFEYIALTICAVFGWTLQQVFALTWPQFEKISFEVESLQFARAKNEVYFGICAALGGGKSQENLMDAAGSFVTEEEPELEFTEEELRMAEERMAEELRKRKEKEKKDDV